MKIPQGFKRKGRPTKAPPPQKGKDIQIAPEDKMIWGYPRMCPICSVPTYSTVCRCGRMTVVNKRATVINK